MYKDSQVIVLPTKDASKLILCKSIDILIYNDNKLREMPNTDQFENQHLYVISDDEIENGDWLINLNNIGKNNGKPFKHNADLYDTDNIDTENIKKIIATTNEFLIKLGDTEKDFNSYSDVLPRLSTEFLNKYCESNGFDKISVEYEWIGIDSLYGFPMGDNSTDGIWKLKLNTKNEIIIK